MLLAHPSEDSLRAVIVAERLAGRTLGGAGGSFVIAEWTDGGGPPDPPRLVAPLHVHHRDDEAWYVLEGTLRFRLGDEEVEAPAGSAVFGPRGVPHTFWNPSEKPARYLLVMTPNTFRLIEEIHASSDRGPATMRALYQQYDCEIVE
jgi:mannose-6-phosphate isomerase-like protein (cupin superfamily)